MSRKRKKSPEFVATVFVPVRLKQVAETTEGLMAYAKRRRVKVMNVVCCRRLIFWRRLVFNVASPHQQRVEDFCHRIGANNA